MPAVELISLTIISYLIGSIPIGYLACKSKGIDIRTIGSGNIGATNVGRALGTKWKLITLLMDAFKGAVCVLTATFYFKNAGSFELGLYPIMAGMFAIIGHNWTIFLNFKGGKGVATSAGAMLCLAPYALLVGFISYLIVVRVTKYVSLGSLIAAFLVPTCLLIRYQDDLQSHLYLIIYAIVMFLMVVFRHKENIKRLIKGEETKIVTKS